VCIYLLTCCLPYTCIAINIIFVLPHCAHLRDVYYKRGLSACKNSRLVDARACRLSRGVVAGVHSAINNLDWGRGCTAAARACSTMNKQTGHIVVYKLFWCMDNIFQCVFTVCALCEYNYCRPRGVSLTHGLLLKIVVLTKCQELQVTCLKSGIL